SSSRIFVEEGRLRRKLLVIDRLALLEESLGAPSPGASIMHSTKSAIQGFSRNSSFDSGVPLNAHPRRPRGSFPPGSGERGTRPRTHEGTGHGPSPRSSAQNPSRGALPGRDRLY